MLLSGDTPPAGAGSALAYYGGSGRLITPPDELGNRIADFSAAGYAGGGVDLPDADAVFDAARTVTVSPVAGDDTASLQAAIDAASAMPLQADGFRGLVRLSAGEFQIADTLRVAASGVVLRGAGHGDGPSDTILRATGGRQYTMLEVGLTGTFARPVADTTQPVCEKYVAVGATSLRVGDASGYAAGDAVIVRRVPNAAWMAELGMNSIPPRGDGGPVIQWDPDNGAVRQDYERVVTRVEGDRLFLNAPVMNALDPRYDISTVFKYTFDRIRNVGVENVRGVSDFSGPTDEDHADTFIALDGVRDAWVRNVTGQHLVYATVHARSRAINVTVRDARSLAPVSRVTGGRRYAFNTDGQFVLMRDLYSEDGRHDFVNNSPWRNRGPNVFFDAVAVDSNSSVGPHQRWSTGTLYDTVVTDDMTEARNRGNFGSGHGWGGANMVFWNNTAREYIVQSPPTAQNWVIGSVGAITNETRFGPQPQGIYSEHGSPIDFQDPLNPASSLYVAQSNGRVEGEQRREYVVGDFDLGESDGAADATNADAAWLADLAAVAAGRPVVGFDDPRAGVVSAATFDFDLAAEDAVAGVLTLGVRGVAGDPAPARLFFDSTASPAALSDLGLGRPPVVGETSVLTLELLGEDLAALQDGRLNIAVEGASLDWAVLDVIAGEESDPPPPFVVEDFDVPEHSEVGIVVGSLELTDPPAGRSPSFGLVGHDGPFRLSEDGLLTVAAEIDFESQPEFVLDVVVTADGEPLASGPVRVNVLDNTTVLVRRDAGGVVVEGTAAEDDVAVFGRGGDLVVWSRHGVTDAAGDAGVRELSVAGVSGDVSLIGCGGDDRLSARGFEYPADVVLDGGDGNDSLRSVTAEVGGRLELLAGPGNDVAVVLATTVVGETAFDGGAGFDRLTASLSDFGGTARVRDASGNGQYHFLVSGFANGIDAAAGDGRQLLRLRDADVSGTVRFDGGADNDHLVVAESGVGNLSLGDAGGVTTAVLRGLTTTGDADFTFAEGGNVRVEDGSIGGGVSVTADGVSRVRTFRAQIGGGLTAGGGGGLTYIAADTTVTGGVGLHSAGRIYASVRDAAVGGFEAAGGDADDKVRIQRTTVAGDLTSVMGGGRNSVNVIGVSAGGRIRIAAGDHDDTVRMRDVAGVGTTTLRLGGGVNVGRLSDVTRDGRIRVAPEGEEDLITHNGAGLDDDTVFEIIS